MVIEFDPASPKASSALQAVLVLNTYCKPPASVVVLSDDDYLASILHAAGYTISGFNGHDAEITACVVGGPASFEDLESAVGSVALNGVTVFCMSDMDENDLARLGLTKAQGMTNMNGTVWLAIKGSGALQMTDVSKSLTGRPVHQEHLADALSELEKRMSERFDRLTFQNTQMINSLDKLGYAVSLKSRLVSVLRHTGTLETAASLTKAARTMRNAVTRRRKAASGPVMQLAPDAFVLGPIVIASSAPIADEIEASATRKQINVVRLSSVLQTSGSGGGLNRPTIGNLGGWLALSDPREVSAIKTFMIDLDDSGVALNLLRGRLRPDQALLIAGRSDSQRLRADLGAPDVVQGRLSFYRAIPEILRESSPATWPITDGTAEKGWPKISMVMVSFNQADFLEEGIQSILDQNYPNLEFILIDAGSSDGSLDIIERYRSRLDKVVIEPDRGQSDGLNKGFDLATGEIFSWLNSDDLLLPGALAKVGIAFRSYGADMIVGGCKQVQQDGRTVVVSHHNHLPLGQAVPLPLNELLDFDNRWQGGAFFYQPEVFFSREIWIRSGGGLRVDLYYVLDYDLWIRMAAAGASIAHIPDFLAASRIHDQQKTTFGENPFIPEARRLLAEYANGVHWTRPSGD